MDVSEMRSPLLVVLSMAHLAVLLPTHTSKAVAGTSKHAGTQLLKSAFRESLANKRNLAGNTGTLGMSLPAFAWSRM